MKAKSYPPKCPVCKGTGIDENVSEDVLIPSQRLCLTCGGTGVIILDKKEENKNGRV